MEFGSAGPSGEAPFREFIEAQLKHAVDAIAQEHQTILGRASSAPLRDGVRQHAAGAPVLITQTMPTPSRIFANNSVVLPGVPGQVLGNAGRRFSLVRPWLPGQLLGHAGRRSSLVSPVTAHASSRKAPRRARTCSLVTEEDDGEDVACQGGGRTGGDLGSCSWPCSSWSAFSSSANNSNPLLPERFVSDASSLSSSSTQQMEMQQWETFELLPMWQGSLCHKPGPTKSGVISSNVDTENMPISSKLMTQSIRMLYNRMIIGPQSRVRNCWDICIFIFVFYDVVLVPLQFLGLDEVGHKGAASWFMALFWTGDIFMTLLTATTQHDGGTETDPLVILKHYARGWLVLDLVLVASAWADIGGIAGDDFRLQPFFRLARMLRLLRLVRLQGILAQLVETNSEMVHLIVSFVKSVCMIVVLVHVLACLFVGLGKSSDANWVYRHGASEQGLLWQYGLAFHWALTQFTGTMELYPYTTSERFFAISCLLFGYLVATVFASNITSLMTQISFVSSQQTIQFKALSRYLAKNHISEKLAERVQRNALHALNTKLASVNEADVEVLKLVSEPLRMELHSEIVVPSLKSHPLFLRISITDPVAMRQVCYKAVQNISLHEADVLFSPGQLCPIPAMFFIVEGILRYSPAADIENAVEVGLGSWMCEHFLWTRWSYHGFLEAATDAHLISLNAAICNDILKTVSYGIVRKYAKRFIQKLNENPAMVSDMSDKISQELVDYSLKQSGRHRLVNEGLPTRQRNRTMGDSDGDRGFCLQKMVD